MGKSSAFRNGLVTYRLEKRLTRLGLDLNLFWLFREGTTTDEDSSAELTNTYPSSILESSDLESATAYESWHTVESFQSRLNEGHVCIAVKDAGRVIGFTWANPRNVHDSACDYPLESGEAYLYDAYVAPAYRGKGLAPYMRKECYRHLHQLGIESYFSISDYFNTPAVRFKKKLRAIPVRLFLKIAVGRRFRRTWVLRDYA
ncbi:MAG: GNAT family N-acetyltransferase [Gammaproteobacteria bacterium]